MAEAVQSPTASLFSALPWCTPLQYQASAPAGWPHPPSPPAPFQPAQSRRRPAGPAPLCSESRPPSSSPLQIGGQQLGRPSPDCLPLLKGGAACAGGGCRLRWPATHSPPDSLLNRPADRAVRPPAPPPGRRRRCTAGRRAGPQGPEGTAPPRAPRRSTSQRT